MRIILPKARLLPVHFGDEPDREFQAQLNALHGLLVEDAEILDPVPLGSDLPVADAVLLPQVLGEAYRRIEQLKAIQAPLLIITSEFGTMAMWDWEIGSYMRAEGIRALAPYNLAQARTICRALGVKRHLRGTTFLVYQDNPGEGFQASIFKRFYWWEDECTQRILRKFGVTILRESFRQLGEAASRISDGEADAVIRERNIATAGLTSKPMLSAAKMYLALKRRIDVDSSIQAAGMNCLNESQFSDTTPCLAWNLLYEDSGLTWGCEGDTMSMLTQHILHRTLEVPIMMTNLYPFLLGQAALKHERISAFPEVTEPENCVLVAHCGYLGVLPRSFSTEWTLRPKVLAIVDNNAHAIDARLPTGPVTLAKLNPKLESLSVAEGNLDGYAQYPGSDCHNGGIVRIRDGHTFVSSVMSHHYLLMTGHHRANLEYIGRIFDLALNVI
jgi:hypothetical protein